MKKLAIVAILGLCVGCASARFRPYVGQQQAWPTADGSIVSVKYDLPVFTSLPPSPYEVLGELRVESWFYQRPEEGHLPVLIRKALEEGAEALVFVQGRLYFSTNYGPPAEAAGAGGEKKATLTQVNTFNPDSFVQDVNILAIKWVGEPPSALLRHYVMPKTEAATPEAAPAPAPEPAPAK